MTDKMWKKYNPNAYYNIKAKKCDKDPDKIFRAH